MDSWHGLPADTDREAWLRQVGEDGFHLLTAVWRPDAPVWLRRIPALQTLRQAWLQQYHRDQAGVRAREGDDLPPGQDRLASPYDAEACYGTKRTTGWVGYCLHITETCDDDAPRLITDVATTSAAEGDDSQALPAVHTRLGTGSCCRPNNPSTADTSRQALWWPPAGSTAAKTRPPPWPFGARADAYDTNMYVIRGRVQ
ncbi:hypothetical protein QF035_010437 [Streptomyces umbrinus]|uniref:Transposase n=1 Tax=Streptomyces umbrinus TaxID=67370 RepID=A0ABU0TAK9_9ACTN|nr:hypothetical protein [Streptomyces umbrinus]MDQ1032855.1 hypothetical protein [Streptomyces umbrinus]